MAHADGPAGAGGKTDDACQRRWQVTVPGMSKHPRSLPVRLWSVAPGVTTDNRGASRTLIQQLTSQLGRPPSCPCNDEVARILGTERSVLSLTDEVGGCALVEERGQ